MDQTIPSPPLISAEERARRIEIVNYARGSVRLEGFILSDEFEDLNHLYIDGESSLKEHGQALDRLYGL